MLTIAVILLLLSRFAGAMIEIKNITSNLGVVPINLGQAKLQISEHKIIHFFDLKPLFEEFTFVNWQFERYLNDSNFNSTMLKELGVHIDIIRSTKFIITEKIANIELHDSNTKRFKRGLINGLGTIIKSITGNLDVNDKKQFSALLKTLKYNQDHIVDQLHNQYSINNDLISQFNKTIKNIQINSLHIAEKIHLIGTTVNLLTIKELLDHIQIIFSLISTTISDIETSLTFCKLNILHPSIINTKTLFQELSKVASHYENKFLYPFQFKFILDIERTMSVECALHENHIIYTMSLPIFEEIVYNLYNLYPIPLLVKDEIITIIPRFKYLLNINNQFKFLNYECIKRNSMHHCRAEDISHHNDPCIQDILQKTSSSNCLYTRLSLAENHIEVIPETSYILVAFYNPDDLQVQQDQDTLVNYHMQGIYLIKSNMNSILYHNKTILSYTKTQGSVTLFDQQALNIQASQMLNTTLQLKNLNFHELQPSHLSHFVTTEFLDDSNSYHIIILWISFIFIVIIIVTFIIFIYYFYKTKIVTHFTQTGEIRI